MATRFQVTDSASNLLTLQLSEDILDFNGQWMPDDTTKVRASSDWSRNPFDGVTTTGQSPYDAVLYTLGDDGVRILVMKMQSILDYIGYEDSGSGTLYASGVQGTFQAGAMTWKKM
jgi:hypothetical protein